MSSIFNYFVFGSNGDDVLVGAADHEQVLFGFAGNDLIEAGGQSDFVLAGRGDDIVIGGAGDETILGGAGYDVSVYEGSISDYDIQSYDWGAVTVTSIGAVSDAGSDTLFDAEALYFAADDVTIFLDGTNNVPIAKDDAVTLGEAGGKIPVATLLANDMDFDGDALTVTGVTATSSMGVAVSLLNGEVIYSPGAKFDGLTPGQTATDMITYTISDGKGGTATATVTITVEGQNEAPALFAVDRAALVEGNTDAAVVIAAQDSDGGTLGYAISGGADASFFNIDTSTGLLSFKTAPSFASPMDAGADNVYDVQIQLADGQGGFATKDIAIEVQRAAPATPPRINEIHYDNAGSDVGEFIEIRVAMDADVSALTVELMNGSNGSVYNTLSVSGGAKTSDASFDYYVLDLPANGLQNGAPDGLALVDGTSVVEFLSYEGTLTATAGAANGMMSNDIGVAETSSTAVGDSLQRGDGDTWNAPAAQTKGAENSGGTPPPPPPPSGNTARINEFHYDNASSDVGEFIEIRAALGTDVSAMIVELMNGSNGTVYNTLLLPSAVKSSDSQFDYYLFDLPANGLQNGSPDGLALSDNGSLIEFLSYEGTFAATAGVANGTTSSDIGQSESGSTAIGDSLQRANDGSWKPEAAETKGAANEALPGGGSGGGTGNPTTTFDITAVSADALEGDSGRQAFQFQVTRSGDTSSAGSVDFALGGEVNDDDIASLVNTGTLNFAAGQTSVTFSVEIHGDTTVEDDETLTVTLSNPVGGSVGTAAASVVVLDDDDITLISAVQGSGDAGSLVGQVVTVKAIVTQLASNGFFLQEEDSDADADATTSEGVFVFTGGAPTVAVGDLVLARGDVEEFFGETQIDLDASRVISSGNPLPTAATVLLSSAAQDFEALEGMRVSVGSGIEGEKLTVIENFNLDRFGEVTISAGDQRQPTQQFDAQLEASQVSALATSNANNRLLLDDGVSRQNPDEFRYIPNTDAGDNGNGFLDSGDTFDADGATFRLGTQLTANAEGALRFGFGEYRLQVDGTLQVDEATNSGARPASPDAVGGALQVASVNVLNFFTTLSGGTGPNGLSPRGARTAEDLQRQTDKLVEAILGTGAEVIALQEIENGGFGTGSAIQALVNALNAKAAPGVTFAFVDPTTDAGFIGTDAITTGLIYDSAKLSVTHKEFLAFQEASAAITFGLADVLNQVASSDDQVGDFQRNRPAVAATFQEIASGEEFTVVSNHFKSKGDSNLEDVVGDAQRHVDTGGTTITQADIDALKTDPNFDQGNGQGFWNQVRTDAASELKTWIETVYNGGGVSNYLVTGDLNAYAKEDPVQVFSEAAGVEDLIDRFIGQDKAYSFVFDGQQGALDHALASTGLASKVTGATEWHINADEPDLLSYNSAFNNAAFYEPSLFAASDHDPLIIGLDLTPGEDPLLA